MHFGGICVQLKHMKSLSAPLSVYYAFGLSIGFGQIFLEFNPVDVRRVAIGILPPPVSAGEEEVLLVR